jgi:hypothetical protein
LPNPSTIAQQQKLELWRTKFEIAGSAPEGMASKNFIRKKIWDLTDKECEEIDNERMNEKIVESAIENASAEDVDTSGSDETSTGSEPESSAGGEGESSDTGSADEENAAEDHEIDDEEETHESQLLTSVDDIDDDESYKLKLKDIAAPVRVKNQIKKMSRVDSNNYNASRRRHHGASSTHMPDMAKMTGHDSDSMNDVYDDEWIRSVVSNPLGESENHNTVSTKPRLSRDIMNMLKNIPRNGSVGKSGVGNVLTEEARDVQDEIDPHFEVSRVLDNDELFNIDDSDDDDE